MFIKWSKFLVENNKFNAALFFSFFAASIKRESQLHPIVIMRDSHLDELEAFFFAPSTTCERATSRNIYDKPSDDVE